MFSFFLKYFLIFDRMSRCGLTQLLHFNWPESKSFKIQQNRKKFDKTYKDSFFTICLSAMDTEKNEKKPPVSTDLQMKVRQFARGIWKITACLWEYHKKKSPSRQTKTRLRLGTAGLKGIVCFKMTQSSSTRTSRPSRNFFRLALPPGPLPWMWAISARTSWKGNRRAE